MGVDGDTPAATVTLNALSDGAVDDAVMRNDGIEPFLRHFGLPHLRLQDAKPVALTPYPGAVREVRAYPVALATKDMRQAEPAVAAIEAALVRPGSEGIQALFALFSGRRINATPPASVASVETRAH